MESKGGQKCDGFPSTGRASRGLEGRMVEMFKTLRNQRASCIQVEGQFVFIILSVLDYIKIKLPKYKEKVNKFMEDFKTALIPSS
ncbi:hypothetical protein Y032_0125g1265 [Ancylostoma ceylanicum]|uniref:Uncharacterized protein n=1 Tax=Ancylostoma ceylanicum TaxID=53326 RepID=A0A016T8S3_9BILA|nr:hypothetical protein Y032_0125g1265 [Ancylostoma ceylanicum]